jgi:hypothetical protein
MIRLFGICLAGILSASSAALAQSTAIVAGRVHDETGAVLPGTSIDLRNPTGALVASTQADATGAYRFERVAAGRYAIEFRLPNFATNRRSDLTLAGGDTVEVNATLVLTMSADVTVTGKRTFRQLADIEQPESGLIGIADAASEGLVTGQQIDRRPIMRSAEVLETVPGLVISQHSGEGKANQYYLRGFNLDHGTDFSTTVAGVPVNMPTHAHGHGYADLNFLIPELVSGVQFRKGPYFADEGDFSSAGAAHIRYVNAVPAPLVRVSGGEDGWARALAAVSPSVGSGQLLLAMEANHNDGPWVRPDDYRRLNGVLRYSRGNTLNAFSLTAMGYDASWDATDQVPLRAVEAGHLARFGGIDDTDGGNSSRYSLSGDWQRTSTAGLTRANAYALRYRLDLFSNFTYLLDDPENGDQFQQADRRTVLGGRVSHRFVSRLGGRASDLLVGGDLRHDRIGQVALFHTSARRVLDAVRDDRVNQTSAAAFGQHELQWTPWLRSNVGVRADVFNFDVTALQPENSGQQTDSLVSPKASVVLGPWRQSEIYVNAGYGYHSNDARGTTIRVDPVTGEPAERVTPLARARGSEVGFRTVPVRGLQTSVALWRLDLDSELIFIGDAGTTEASRPSRRYGVEWETYLSPTSWLTIDADLAWSHSRFTDDDPAGNRIPGSVERVASAGVTADDGARWFGSLRLRYFGARNLVEDGSVRSTPTRLLNGQAGVRLTPGVQLVLDAFNLLNAEASDIDYLYASRLPGEPAEGVEDIHFHPTLPRTVRLGVQFRF